MSRTIKAAIYIFTGVELKDTFDLWADVEPLPAEDGGSCQMPFDEDGGRYLGPLDGVTDEDGIEIPF